MFTSNVSRHPGRWCGLFAPALAACAAALLGIASLPSSASAQSAVLLDGTNDHVTFGAASALGASQFTLETWFKRTGAGVATSTGSGGVTAVPLVAKGRAEADGSVVDMNYFFGIRGTDSVLVADYEEGTGQTSPGLNHPLVGTTPLQRDVWYHGAATFDGTTLRLYLNGNLEASLAIGAGRLPQSASTQHASLGSALTSAGTAAGFFKGAIDEARIWNVAKSQAQIQADMPLELTSGTGLLGRWGLNEGSGTTAASSRYSHADCFSSCQLSTALIGPPGTSRVYRRRGLLSRPARARATLRPCCPEVHSPPTARASSPSARSSSSVDPGRAVRTATSGRRACASPTGPRAWW